MEIAFSLLVSLKIPTYGPTFSETLTPCRGGSRILEKGEGGGAVDRVVGVGRPRAKPEPC